MNTILNLGDIPLVNNLKESLNDSINVNRYPINVVIEEDLTVRLDTQIDPKEMFSDYLYRSGVSEPYKHHCNTMLMARCLIAKET